MSERSIIDFRASAESPCPVCSSGSKGCSRTDNGLHLCRGGSADVDFVRVAEPDEGGFIGYRRRDDDKANPTKQKVQRPKKATAGKPKSVTDFTARAKTYVDDLRPGDLDLLAGWLQLPVTVFDRVPLLGLSRIADGCKVFGFPEHNADGHVCGITERYQNGKKEMQPGGMRGITVPTGWNDYTASQTDESGPKSGPKYLFLAEGASDTLALTAAGLHALGRPAASAGIEFLVEILADPANAASLADVTIVVMGENDERTNPTTGKKEWPGRTGAVKCQQRLSDALRRPIMLAFPPEDAKDVRAWLTAQPEATPWAERGATLVSRLTLTTVDPPLLTETPAVGSAEGIDSPSFASAISPTAEATQLVEGADPARWDHDPDNPERLATLFLKTITPDGEPYHLRFWRDEFHVYRGGYYETLSRGDFEARMTRFISKEFKRVHRLELEVWDGKSADSRGPK